VPESGPPTRETPLTELHRAAGVPLVEVEGFTAPERFGDPAGEERFAREAVGVIDESRRGVLGIRGMRVAEFLQRLLSSDVKQLAGGRGQPSALLTGKGKLVAAFELFRDPAAGAEERFRLVFGEPLREEVLRAVEKYAVLEGLEVKDATPERGIISVQGPRAAAAIRALGIGLPAGPLEETASMVGGVRIACRKAGATPAGGFEVEPASPQLWEALLGVARTLGGGPVGHLAAERLRVEARVPRWGVDFDGQNFPNEAGWDAALSYTKGCYIGQEVIARMRTYGHLNRRLMAVELPPGAPAAAGTPLFSGGKEVGAVTSSAPCAGAVSPALSMLRTPATGPGARLSPGSPGAPPAAVVTGVPRLRAAIAAPPPGAAGAAR
jgi:folate-binding protein YgfZ